jgi:hypothetical protein
MILVLLFILFFIFPKSALAVCPVCTVAVGAGLSASRFLGIDDVITGVWIGGIIVSSGLWLSSWLKNKGYKVRYLDFISVLTFFAFVVLPLYWGHIIGIKNNTLWGVDKVLLGILVGILVFTFGVWFDGFLRKKNNGKVYFYYQKVIIPVFSLTFTSFIFYLILS